MPSRDYGAKSSYIYFDDQNNSYTVRLYAVIAAAGGFQAGIGAKGPWPYHQKNMRRMDCVDANGKKARIPINQTTNSDWESAVTKTVSYLTGSRTYSVTGFTGERKWVRYVA